AATQRDSGAVGERQRDGETKWRSAAEPQALSLLARVGLGAGCCAAGAWTDGCCWRWVGEDGGGVPAEGESFAPGPEVEVEGAGGGWGVGWGGGGAEGGGADRGGVGEVLRGLLTGEAFKRARDVVGEDGLADGEGVVAVGP